MATPLPPMPAERQTGCRELQLRVPTTPWKLIEPLFTFRVETTAREMPNLVAEIRPHNRDVILSQTAHQLVLKIFPAGGDRAAVTLLKRAPALIDVFLQAVVQILVTPALCNLRLIVELDLIHQQSCEAL